MRYTAYVFGLLGLALTSVACGGGGGGGGGSCLANQYFVVQWEVDDAGGKFVCGEQPAASATVFLTTDLGDVLEVGRACDDNHQYNYAGSTASGIPAGTFIIAADLVDDVDGSLLSTVDPVPLAAQVEVPPCNYAQYTFQFPI